MTTANASYSPTTWANLPEIDLRQLLRLSDDTGMLQHAIFNVPDPNHGYCIDDNARALIAAMLYSRLREDDERVVPMHRYLTFLTYAFNQDTSKFRNFMAYDRSWLEDEGSHDSQGRTIWALGVAVNFAPNDAIRELALDLIQRAMPAIEDLQYIRSWTFALIGLDEYLKHVPDDQRAITLRNTYAEKLFKAYQDHATDDWPWWEDLVTYDNAKLCQALMISGAAMQRSDMIEAALTSLRWLLNIQTNERGELSIIGNEGWLKKGQPKAQFDQQPLEAHAFVQACLTAAYLTDDTDAAWADEALRCFDWFLGRNDLGVSLYHPDTGGCQDGLHPTGANKNQGAESSLAYLLSVLELHLYREQKLGRVVVSEGKPKTLGYAIVGASSFAKFCLENYAELEGLKPVAVWNRTASRAEQLAEEKNLRAYEDINDLLRDPLVHVIHVASTPNLHAEQTLTALNAGKHVLCEKPIATTVADAQAMHAEAKKRDLTLGINFMMRYGPLVEPIRQLIDSQILGVPLRGQFVNRAGDGGLPLDHWFWDEDVSGGIFIEHAVHFFDLMNYWLEDVGSPRVVSAMKQHRPQTGIIDQVACDVVYGEQTSISFYNGFHQSAHLDQQDLRLIFERGQLTYNGWIGHSMMLEAALDESQIAAVQAILPGAELKTVQRFTDEHRHIMRRQHAETVDRLVQFHWPIETPKQLLYGKALSALMQDMMLDINDHQHRMKVRPGGAVLATDMAATANRLAGGLFRVTPAS